MKIENCKLKIFEGFTLVEILIYTAIFAIVGGLMTGVLLTVTQVQQRESASAEVTGQLNLVMQTINRLVRESSNIEIEAGTTVSTLKLRMKDTAKDPTCISLVSGVIKLAEGPGTNPNNCKSETSDLTSDRVIVNTFNFKKFTQYPGHDTVSIDIQMTYNSTNPKSQVQRTLSSAIARVSAATFDSDVVPGGTYNFNLGQAGAPWQKVIMADGTASNPSYTFANDSSLGIFKVSGTSTIGFSTQGLERMRVSANGNVGIGTTTPATIFHVYVPTDTGINAELRTQTAVSAASAVWAGVRMIGGNTNADWAIGTNRVDMGGSADNLFFYKAAGTTGAKMVIQDNGNVGIGTTTPTTAKLVVDGTISASAPTADSHVTTKAWVLANAGGGGASTRVEFRNPNTTSPYSYSWTVPSGKTTIYVTMCGAGGAGGTNADNPANGCGGGGAGACVINYPMTVTPGESLTVYVGQGGGRANPETCSGGVGIGGFSGGNGYSGYDGGGGGGASKIVAAGSTIGAGGGGGGGGYYSAYGAGGGGGGGGGATGAGGGGGLSAGGTGGANGGGAGGNGPNFAGFGGTCYNVSSQYCVPGTKGGDGGKNYSEFYANGSTYSYRYLGGRGGQSVFYIPVSNDNGGGYGRDGAGGWGAGGLYAYISNYYYTVLFPGKGGDGFVVIEW